MRSISQIPLTNVHISIETFVQIPLEHNLYVHGLSTNQVDNELEQEQVVTFVRDRRQHARFEKASLFIERKNFPVTSSGINDRQTPRTTPRLVIVVSIWSTARTSSSYIVNIIRTAKIAPVAKLINLK
jgi:hypothetical protein